MDSVVAELEGSLVKDPDPFSYFMLIAYEASGLIRFALLLLFWPIVRLLSLMGQEDAGLKLTIFISVAGLRVSEIRSVARAVLPKFYMDDLNMDAWKVVSQYDKKVVVTKTPRIMVERFAKEHLMADEVIGSELSVTRLGFATGLVTDFGTLSGRVAKLFGDEKPSLGLGRLSSFGNSESFMSVCKEQCHPPFTASHKPLNGYMDGPRPVIFHDGRLVNRPTPANALLLLLWFPIGVPLSIIRIIISVIVPVWAIPYETPIFGGSLILKGNPPPPLSSTSTSSNGVLFVCNHRMFMDPVILSYALGRKIPAVTYSLSRVTEILSPIPTIRLSRDRDIDAKKVKKLLEKGDLVVCPEGTTCREPFLLRFSALFAELTDRIVPVAVNCRVGLFHPTKARGWKGLDLPFFLMNPTSVYEVTFLNQLEHKDTCSGGKSPYEVANYVQSLIGKTLGFECTNLTRKDKYRLLAENDGTVRYNKTS